MKVLVAEHFGICFGVRDAIAAAEEAAASGPLSILGELFPNSDVVGIYCGDFIWGLGAIHCATQQQPSVPS